MRCSTTELLRHIHSDHYDLAGLGSEFNEKVFTGLAKAALCLYISLWKVGADGSLANPVRSERKQP